MPRVGAGPVSELDENCAVKEFLDLGKCKKCSEGRKHQACGVTCVLCYPHRATKRERVVSDSVLEALWVGAPVGKRGLLEGTLVMARGEGIPTQDYWA